MMLPLCLLLVLAPALGAPSFEAYVSAHGKAEAYGARGGAEWGRREALYASRVASISRARGGTLDSRSPC